MIIPVRTSSDTASSADINEISSEALDKGGSGQLALLTEEASPASGDWYLLEKSGGALRRVDSDNVGGGGDGTRYYDFPAGSWDYPTADPAPLDTDTGTNGTIKRHIFDDTTPESVINIIKIPDGISATATLTVEFWGYSTTADGNEVQYRLGYSAVADTESWDKAFSNLDSGDKTTSGAQDILNKYTFSDTLDNLSISPGELVRIKFTRIAIDDGTPVSGDWGKVYAEIRIA